MILAFVKRANSSGKLVRFNRAQDPSSGWSRTRDEFFPPLFVLRRGQAL